VFAPKTHLPAATAYKVTVPAGTRALDGSSLREAYGVSFRTPGPKLVRMEPGAGATHLAANQAFELRFNQPVSPKEIERAARLAVGEGDKARAIAFRATRPKPETPMLVKIAPSA